MSCQTVSIGSKFKTRNTWCTRKKCHAFVLTCEPFATILNMFIISSVDSGTRAAPQFLKISGFWKNFWMNLYEIMNSTPFHMSRWEVSNPYMRWINGLKANHLRLSSRKYQEPIQLWKMSLEYIARAFVRQRDTTMGWKGERILFEFWTLMGFGLFDHTDETRMIGNPSLLRFSLSGMRKKAFLRFLKYRARMVGYHMEKNIWMEQ